MSKPVVNEFFAKLYYGAARPEVGREEQQKWGLAVLKIVSADGFSEAEKDCLAELGRHFGAPEEMIQAALKVDVSKLDLAEILRGFKDGAPARAMLWDAMLVASADGFSESERAFAARAAKLLGIEPSVYHSILAMFEADMALRRARAALLFPEARG